MGSLSKATLGMATLSKLQVGESLLFSGKEIEVRSRPYVAYLNRFMEKFPKATGPAENVSFKRTLVLFEALLTRSNPNSNKRSSAIQASYPGKQQQSPAGGGLGVRAAHSSPQDPATTPEHLAPWCCLGLLGLLSFWCSMIEFGAHVAGSGRTEAGGG